MVYDMTSRVAELRRYYDALLAAKIENLSKLSGVDKSRMIPLNPVDFIEKNKYQRIDGYEHRSIRGWLLEVKTEDNFLISPCDEDAETANQIAYKSGMSHEKIRASKCITMPVPGILAKAFYLKNHRQSPPLVSGRSVSWALVWKGQIVACMTYDVCDGAVRGNKGGHYELLRLAIKHGFQIPGGASRLQKHCEEALRQLGETKIFSYSNATINNGRVYEQLGFTFKRIDNGQPFVMMRDNRLVRLANLIPNATDLRLAEAGRIKTHIGGNKLWVKEI